MMGDYVPLRTTIRQQRLLRRDGYVLVVVSDRPQWTLTELGRWLEQSELGIVEALNLDGGPSTGPAISTPAVEDVVDSETAVPQVLVIEAR